MRFGFAVLVSSARAAGGARCKKRPPTLIRDLAALANYRRAHFHYFIGRRRVYLPQPAAGIFLLLRARRVMNGSAFVNPSAAHHASGRTPRVKKRPPTGSLFISTTVALSDGAPPCERRCAPCGNLRLFLA